MGLDMYLYKEKIVEDTEITDENGLVGTRVSKERYEIAYWRKHNRLHGYMERIWIAKQPKEIQAPDFNCIPLELSKQNIDNIIAALVHETMPPQQGFFFGFDSYNPEQYKKDIALFQECLGLQEQGWTIIYNSWW